MQEGKREEGETGIYDPYESSEWGDLCNGNEPSII